VRRQLLAALMLLCLAWSCGSAPAEKPVQTPAPQQTYALKGSVVALDKPGKKLTVSHEDIPGFMTAMTMAYQVKDEKLIESLAVGDQITAELVKEDEQYWLQKIVVVSPGK
jgi:protein SCO1/2